MDSDERGREIKKKKLKPEKELQHIYLLCINNPR
jgi:hypothetical protein